MSRLRFGILLVLVVALVGVGSFAAGVALLDDDEPDPPPTRGPDDDSTSSGTTQGTDATADTGTDSGTTPESGFWVAIVSSDSDEGVARSRLSEIETAGFPAGVLRSDDHESLNPGFWVAYAGPYPTRGLADAAVEALAEADLDAYPRCVGTQDECP